MKKKLIILGVFLAGLAIFILASKKSIIDLEGNGTESSPYLISSIEDLKTFSEAYDGSRSLCVKLTSDLDLSQYEYVIGSPSVIPIFRGSFDGDGHTITNLDLHPSLDAKDYEEHYKYTLTGSIKSRITDGYVGVGFFGAILGGSTISDLSITNADISSNFANYYTNSNNAEIGLTAVGILAGLVDLRSSYQTQTQISGCSAQGSIASNVSYGNIGGLIGYVSSTTKVSDSHSYVEISGNVKEGSVGGFIGKTAGEISNSSSHSAILAQGAADVGGFAGKVAGIIDTSFADTDIELGNTLSSATMKVGGFAGRVGSAIYLQSFSGIVLDSFAVGSISGTIHGQNYIGGFAGIIDSPSSGTEVSYINKTYNLVDVSVAGNDGDDSIKGIAAQSDTDTSIRNSIYSSFLVMGEQASNLGDVPSYTYNVSPDQLKRESFLESSPIFTDDCWLLSEGEFPLLSENSGALPGGFMGNRIEISDLESFEHISDKAWASYTITRDIDFQWAFMPVTYTFESPFCGDIQGNDFSLSNISISYEGHDGYSSVSTFGLFEYANGAVFRSLFLEDCFVNGYTEGLISITVGTLVGIAKQTVISDVSVTGTARATSVIGTNMIGGLVGMCDNSTLERVAVSVDLFSTMTNIHESSLNNNYMGGICGYSLYGNLTLTEVIYSGEFTIDSVRSVESNIGIIIGHSSLGTIGLEDAFYVFDSFIPAINVSDSIVSGEAEELTIPSFSLEAPEIFALSSEGKIILLRHMPE